MSAWMLQSLLAATLLAGAAVAIEEGARLLRRPQRWSWVIAMVAAVALPGVFRFFPAPSEAATSGGTLDPALLEALLSGAPNGAPVTLLDRLEGYAVAADPFLLVAWCAAAFFMAAGLLLTYRRLLRVRSAGRRTEIAGVPARITRSTGPMVVGLRRPEVVVPAWIDELPEEQQRLVLRHEWEHVRAGDTRLLMAAAVLVAAMPWNLPLWWMRRRLRQSIEVDCDARVLAAGADRRLYGRILIHTAGRPRPASLLAPTLVELPSLLERRIIAMTQNMPAHPRLRLGTAALFAALLVVAACELSPRGSAPSPTEPTLAEVVEGEVQEGESEITRVVASLPLATRISPDGVVTHGRILENGDTVWSEPVRIRFRGDGLGFGDEEPIFFVDGERVESIESLNPDRIVSINVLKGATALEQYGAGAEDGVVLITTGEPPVTRIRRAPAAADAPQVEEIAVVADEVVAAGYGVRARAAAVESVTAEVEAVAGEVATTAGEITAVGYGTASTAEVQRRVRAAATAPVAVRAEDFATTPGAKAVIVKGVVTGSASSVAAPRQSRDPLIVVEGQRFNLMADALHSLDPDSIDSIEVIKDSEAAVALYGPRASNGVIVITLKKQ